MEVYSDFKMWVEFFAEQCGWPIDEGDFRDYTFEYNPEELGIRDEYAAEIRTIKQLRPLSDSQPWGIFYIEFEQKKLPIGVMRRILRALVKKQRTTRDKQATWHLENLIFLTSSGEGDERSNQIIHFSEADGMPVMKAIGWDTKTTELSHRQAERDLSKLNWPKDETDANAWKEQWTSAFRLRHREVIKTSQQLAIEMAHLAKTIRDQVKAVFEFEVSNGPLHKLFENFKTVIIHDLDIDTFADMYAQTIAYGLLSARAAQEGEFKVENISAIIPITNPFLKQLFTECTKISDDEMENLDIDELGVVELIDMLKESNIEAVLADFGRQKKGEDPVIHFYENFLSEYDKAKKVERGVFYTPDPVVSFIVRSVDEILEKEFGLVDGLADTTKIKVKNDKGEVSEVHKVQILDPAVGTGTFLKHTIEQIKLTFDDKYKFMSKEDQKKKWNEYVANDLLPRMYGFELMMAPYAVCHLKLGLKLAETGYGFKKGKRLGVYLTNSLESASETSGPIDKYVGFITEEADAASKIKSKKRIFVIIGNPPYSGESANKGDWIMELMEDYKKEPEGMEKLKEHNSKWINDDYVKFLRCGQHYIENNGVGILAFINAHGFLDNPTFRGMRWHLLKTFDAIYCLDLHGNAKKKETCPDGSKDENVFDIQQGVSINLFIKTGKKKANELGHIHHFDLFGIREVKYNFLAENSMNTVSYKSVEHTIPNYSFDKKDLEGEGSYTQGFSIIELFSLNSLGLLTKRDDLSIGFDKEELKNKINYFLDETLGVEEVCNKFGLVLKDKDKWDAKITRKNVAKSNIEHFIRVCQYRPFDNRVVFYNPFFIARPNTKVLGHFIKENIGLIICRQGQAVGGDNWNVVFICKYLTDQNIYRRGGGTIFPLYLYDETTRKHNLNSTIIQQYAKGIDLKFTPEKEQTPGTFAPIDILDYIYAVLHSPSYREKYKEFLKIDFPRVPYPDNAQKFWKLVKLGGELRQLHLLESSKVNEFITSFPVTGGNGVEKPKYKDERVWINPTQFFDGVPEVAWEFYIGGYQPAQKWLKDRKGRKLSKEDVEHYQRIIVALTETDRIMREIDKVVGEYGGWG